jgi:hypothetical protein
MFEFTCAHLLMYIIRMKVIAYGFVFFTRFIRAIFKEVLLFEIEPEQQNDEAGMRFSNENIPDDC